MTSSHTAGFFFLVCTCYLGVKPFLGANWILCLPEICIKDLHQNYTELNIYKMETLICCLLFLYSFGPVHSVKLLSARRCAFVNYINKEDCERAIQEMHVSGGVFFVCFGGWLFLPSVTKQVELHLQYTSHEVTEWLERSVSLFHNGKQTVLLQCLINCVNSAV